MVDFVQTMKDWRRMCKVYSTDDDDCCNGCPVVDFHEHGCGAIFEMEDSTDWERYEGQIREWAAEHPEPVYPCWFEWLEEQGVVGINMDKGFTLIKPEIRKPIPADIAQKLGLQPKER